MGADMTMALDGSEYTALTQKDGSYTVEVRRPSQLLTFTEGFKTKGEVEQWIYMIRSRQLPRSPLLTPDLLIVSQVAVIGKNDTGHPLGFP
jgi:hypothetical protein